MEPKYLMSWGHQIWKYWQTQIKKDVIIFFYFGRLQWLFFFIRAKHNFNECFKLAHVGIVGIEYSNHPLQKLSSQVCRPLSRTSTLIIANHVICDGRASWLSFWRCPCSNWVVCNHPCDWHIRFPPKPTQCMSNHMTSSHLFQLI